MRLVRRAWLLPAALLAAAAGCGKAPAPKVYVVKGVVQEIHTETKEVVVAHEDIPGFMEAMTMPFRVLDAKVLQGVAPKEKIVFRLVVTDSGYHIESIEPAEPRKGAQLPDFELTAVAVDQTRTLRRRDLEGKVWIADFMFTRCSGPCPLNSGKMEGLQKRLPKDVLLASFTVDPAYDQEKVLRRYARRFHAEPGRWLFLTAPNEEAVIPLFKDSFRTAYRPSAEAPCG